MELGFALRVCFTSVRALLLQRRARFAWVPAIAPVISVSAAPDIPWRREGRELPSLARPAGVTLVPELSAPRKLRVTADLSLPHEMLSTSSSPARARGRPYHRPSKSEDKRSRMVGPDGAEGTLKGGDAARYGDQKPGNAGIFWVALGSPAGSTSALGGC